MIIYPTKPSSDQIEKWKVSYDRYFFSGIIPYLHPLFCKCEICKLPDRYIAQQSDSIGVGNSRIEAIINCMSGLK